MPAFSPALLERLVALLASGDAPFSSCRVAREVLGIATDDETLASQLVATLVRDDARVERRDAGWVLRRDAGDTSPSLRDPFVAVFAPAHLPVFALHPATAAAAALCVAATGEDEIERARALGCPLDGAAIALGDAARLLRGYRGPASPDALAEALGVRVVEDARDAGAMARLVAAGFESLVDQLELEGVTTLAGLRALVEQALGEAQLSGRRFTRDDLEGLDEGPGVYVFRDGQDAVLYVGQSLSLRARVGSYFCGPARDEKDRVLRASADSLETETCDSGPDALIREAKLIRRLRPRLNTQRQVTRPASTSGVLFTRDPRREDRAVLFALESGRLVARGVARGRGTRALATVDRILEAWRGARGDPAGGDEEAARLVASWRRARPGDPFFERGLTGDDDAIREAILAELSGDRG